MPVVGRELNGLAAYAISFSAPMAVSVLGIALAGSWTDARGPAPVLRFGVGLFSLGLAAAALAPTMAVFLVGRGVQGFGSGLAGVGMYVLIAKAYPQAMRARVFTVLTSGWVLPALAGPAAAGALNDLLGWRWVFGLAPAVAVVAWLALFPALRRTSGTGAVKNDGARAVWAAAVAAGILGVGYAGQRETGWWALLLRRPGPRSFLPRPGCCQRGLGRCAAVFLP